MAFSPITKLVYVPALESSSFYAHDENFTFNEKTWNIGISMMPRGGTPANPTTIAAAPQAGRPLVGFMQNPRSTRAKSDARNRAAQ